MPQASDELRAQWPGGDTQAIDHLDAKGFIPTRDFCWIKPCKDYHLTNRDNSALDYLFEEWDYGGIVEKGIDLWGQPVETPDRLEYRQPRLTAWEQYFLGWLSEEAVESVKMAVGKTLRFGFKTPGRMGPDGEPDFSYTPESELHEEIGDLLASLEFGYRTGVLNRKRVCEARNRKILKILNETDNLGRPLAPPLPPLPVRSDTGDILEPELSERQRRYEVFILDEGKLWTAQMSYAVPHRVAEPVKKPLRERLSKWLWLKRWPRKSDDMLDFG